MPRREIPIPDRMRKFAIYTTASRINPLGGYVSPGTDVMHVLDFQMAPVLRRINEEGTLVVRIAPDISSVYYSFKLTREEFEEAVTLAKDWCAKGLNMEQMDAEEEKVRAEAAELKEGTSIHALEGGSEENANYLVNSLRMNGWFPGKPYKYEDTEIWCVEVADTPYYSTVEGAEYEIDTLDEIARRFGFAWSAHETTFRMGG